MTDSQEDYLLVEWVVAVCNRYVGLSRSFAREKSVVSYYSDLTADREVIRTRAT